MTFKGAIRKKFGKGILSLLPGRIWHIFCIYAHEYKKGLTPAERAKFEEVFGE